MKCAIMQPTFLPWAGYFRLIAQVDRFVFLDDVQLARQSWQTRNRVLVKAQEHWVMAPVLHVALEQTIAQTCLMEKSPWRRKLGRLLRMEYVRHLFFQDLLELIQFIEEGNEQSLAELNISIINFCLSRLSIATPVFKSSEMPVTSEQRTERLLEICRYLQCETYLSPPGSKEYLLGDGFTQQKKIRLEFADYPPPPYMQKGVSNFVSHLSIIDVVSNLGWDGASAYIQAPCPNRESELQHLNLQNKQESK
jgi:hypothetical protein